MELLVARREAVMRNILLGDTGGDGRSDTAQVLRVRTLLGRDWDGLSVGSGGHVVASREGIARGWEG